MPMGALRNYLRLAFCGGRVRGEARLSAGRPEGNRAACMEHMLRRHHLLKADLKTATADNAVNNPLPLGLSVALAVLLRRAARELTHTGRFAQEGHKD